MNTGLLADLTSCDQFTEGVPRNNRDLQTVSLVERLHILEGTIENAEPAREVYQVFMALVMSGVIQNLRLLLLFPETLFLLLRLVHFVYLGLVVSCGHT